MSGFVITDQKNAVNRPEILKTNKRQPGEASPGKNECAHFGKNMREVEKPVLVQPQYAGSTHRDSADAPKNPTTVHTIIFITSNLKWPR